jgi:hypothetical protein
MLRRIAQISLAIAVLSVSLVARPQALPNEHATGSAAGMGAVAWEPGNVTTARFHSGATGGALYAGSTLPETGVGEMLVRYDAAAVASFDFNDPLLPSDDPPYGAGSKVPEPSTLLLLGTGLIGIARISRVKIKLPRWSLHRTTTTRVVAASQP